MVVNWYTGNTIWTLPSIGFVWHSDSNLSMNFLLYGLYLKLDLIWRSYLHSTIKTDVDFTCHKSPNTIWYAQRITDVKWKEIYKSRVTCLCCWSCCSCMDALSFSNITGNMRIVKLEASIHIALRLNLKQTLVEFHVKLVAVEHTLRTDSGNISVRPHNLSASDSSTNSWKCIKRNACKVSLLNCSIWLRVSLVDKFKF